jgi:hypothetical protein
MLNLRSCSASLERTAWDEPVFPMNNAAQGVVRGV